MHAVITAVYSLIRLLQWLAGHLAAHSATNRTPPKILYSIRGCVIPLNNPTREQGQVILGGRESKRCTDRDREGGRGIQVRGLPSVNINNQVKKLQDEVKTYTGRQFVKVSCGVRIDEDCLKPIDLICWLSRVGDFRTDWNHLEPDFYPLYIAILFGLVLARLGKVIEVDTPITCVMWAIVEQYERGEGLLPAPNTKLPPAPRPSIHRPVIPRHSQLYPGDLSVWASVIVVLLLLLVMSTLVAPQLAPPRGTRSFW
ncbi:hypothetical protein EDB80DRAFT_777302 [Ilyonectria destructans]|nr:hypothetical protein EDB80DRAFT_777302 [Ilyonectria destructans]